MATTDVPVSGSTLVVLPVTATNTASPVTVQFNGGPILTVKSNTGNDIAVGGVVAGMLLFGYKKGTMFELISDQVSSAIVATAQTAATAAQAALAAFVGAYTVRTAGATGNGISDDRAAIATADASGAKDIVFPAGTYRIASDLTINNHVTKQPGAVIILPTGVTLTLAGGFDSPADWAFQCLGTGKVVFTKRPAVGRLEWWGATFADSGVSNAQAQVNQDSFVAATTACPYVRMPYGTLYTMTAIQWTQPYSTVEGAGEFWEANKGGTRICVLSGSEHTLIMGPTSQPANLNLFTYGQSLRNVNLTRGLEPIPLATSGNLVQPSGLYNRWTLGSNIEHVGSTEHTIGFNISGVVSCKLTDCYDNRSGLGTGANTANDIHWGIFLNGAAGIAAGGNASIYLTRCRGGGGSPANVDNTFIKGVGKLADTFIVQCEAAGGMTGILLQGDGSLYGNMDIHLSNNICDTCTLYGTRVLNMFGQMTMQGDYAACSGAAAIANFSFENCTGFIRATGLQSIGLPAYVAGSQIAGVNIVNSQNVAVSVMDKGSRVPCDINTCSFCDVDVQAMSDAGQPASTAVPMIWLRNASARNTVRLTSQGPNKYGSGVFLDGTTGQNEINVTKITAAPGNGIKISNNGTTISAVGSFGSGNLVTGIF